MDTARIKATWEFELRNADGTIVDRWAVTNFLTEDGREHVAARVALSPPSAMTHMAIGDDTGQTEASTTLANELARVALTTGDPSVSGSRIRFQGVFAAGTPGSDATITEAAVFSASSGGTMMNYATGFSKPKASTQSLTVNVYVDIVG